MQRYSTPLVFNKIGWWINSVSDRYIVAGMLGSDGNGVYTVAYKIPTILTACSDIFAQAWQLSAIKEFDSEDSDHFVLNMYKLYNALLVIVCLGLILLTIPMAKIFTVSSLIGAAANVIPNFILIAVMHSAMEAAVATMLSNIVIWMVRFYRVRRYIKFRYSNCAAHSYVSSFICQVFGFAVGYCLVDHDDTGGNLCASDCA